MQLTTKSKELKENYNSVGNLLTTTVYGTMVVNISIKEATPEPSTMKLRLLWPSTTLPTSDLGNTYVVGTFIW